MGFVGRSSVRMSTSSSSATRVNVYKSGWLVFVHHFDTVAGSLSSCSASHLLVRSVSASTAFTKNFFKIVLIPQKTVPLHCGWAVLDSLSATAHSQFSLVVAFRCIFLCVALKGRHIDNRRFLTLWVWLFRNLAHFRIVSQNQGNENASWDVCKRPFGRCSSPNCTPWDYTIHSSWGFRRCSFRLTGQCKSL